MKKVSKEKNVFKEYDNAIEGIWYKFLIKHEWVDENGVPQYDKENSKIREFIIFADMVINLQDAIYDIENDVSNEKYEEWDNYNIQHVMNGYDGISYTKYLSGKRIKERTPLQEFIYKAKEKTSHIYYCLRYAKQRRELREIISKKLDEIQCN